jgi:hypothetical protein
MPKNLKRFYGKGTLHFITCSCYRRRPLLRSVRARNAFVRILGEVRSAYGFALVGDVVMPERVQGALGATPAVLVMNKFDLTADWEITPEMEQDLRGRGWEPVHSSAKTGEGVEEAFLTLSRAMLGRKP